MRFYVAAMEGHLEAARREGKSIKAYAADLRIL
jgi:hypothetical protein